MITPLNDSVKPIIPKRRKLTAKQEGFVKDFIETKNAAEAVRRNYDVTSASKDTVYAIAHENLQKPSIQGMIEEMKANYVQDSYEAYAIQKQLLRKTLEHPKQWELTNKIANKIQDRAGFAPVKQSESKHMTAKFVITRGEHTPPDTSINPSKT